MMISNEDYTHKVGPMFPTVETSQPTNNLIIALQNRSDFPLTQNLLITFHKIPNRHFRNNSFYKINNY